MAAGAAQQSKSARSNGPAPVTAQEWISRGVHTITCPSGVRVKIRIPDLSALMAGKAVPENLRGAALIDLAGGLAAMERDEQGIPKLSDDVLKGETDLRFWLVREAVVEPALTEDDVRRLPVEDRDLIVALAQRQTAYDALGVRIGVSPLALFEPFSREHLCDAQCPSCEAVRRQLPGAGVGVV